jgi:queuine tRNA-ribosyltransferase
MSLKFTVQSTDKNARTGIITTSRGVIKTPVFMPVGTAATVKAMVLDDVRLAGADIILGNVYHLMLRPGAERIARLGGLHKFMNWPYPILTDSGGFQVMSLSKLRKLSEEGVVFQSHIDGSKHLLTPERSLEIQDLLGSDIQMQFDECIKLPCSDDEASRAMNLSLRWAERSREAFHNVDGRGIFGIVQGGSNKELRRQSAKFLAEMDFDGLAVGGLAVGEPQQIMLEMLETTLPHLPTNKPHYLMGVGTPDDIIKAVCRGIDMFDCVMPTRAGRHGLAYTRYGAINIRNAKYAEDPRPLDPQSACVATNGYSRAYLHHLVRSHEILGMMLLTQSNIAYYLNLMQGIREAITKKSFEEFVLKTTEDWKKGDI